MPRNKPRLQLALYARPKFPGTYHYALFVCPKNARQQHSPVVTKHHALNTLQVIAGEAAQPWRYERSTVDVDNERYFLVRVIIGKVTSLEALDGILKAVPVYQVHDRREGDAQAFSCKTWVRAALEDLRGQGAVGGLGQWDEIQRESLQYVEDQKAEGRWSEGGKLEVPVLDLSDGRRMAR